MRGCGWFLQCGFVLSYGYLLIAFSNPMTTRSKSHQSIQYSPRVVKRAERAVRCSPFQRPLFEAMRSHGVALKAIASHNGVQSGYTREPLAELAAENALMWLIQTGLLRREVDGQGLTDSFRLTPLGRQLVERWRTHATPFRDPSWLDRVQNMLSRWFRWPDWLQ